MNKLAASFSRRGRIIIVLSLFLASFITSSVSAIDKDFFAGNDILFYNPDLCTVTNQAGDVALTGNDVAEKIFRFLTSTSFSGLGNKPFSALQAAGALGNFQQESSMNPAAVQSPGTGIGLAQWSSDFGNPRKANLLSLASSMGKQWQDLEVQMKMIQNEINASYGKSLIAAGFDSVTAPEQAAFIFQKIYEGAGNPQQANRDSAAKSYYSKFQSIAPAASSTLGPVGTAGGCAGNGQASAFASDGFVIYNQFDSQWGGKVYGNSTVADAGCGPSAMAMIITALTGQSVTPIETTDYANATKQYDPLGSKWTIAATLAEHWGLKAKNISTSVAAINDTLRAGGLVITSGKGPSPFTSGGHYIVIRAVTEGGKWLIGDSNGNVGIENSKKEWDPAAILTNANSGNIVAITK